MIEYKKQLNPEQLRVVMEDGGPILVIAGAGSGKTRTLTYRVARLIESKVEPGRILLATFTNKAARSMLLRVKTLVDGDLSTMWGGTFHHIAHRILREHSHVLGYERNFSIMDSEDSTQLINACISEQGINFRKEGFPRGDVLKEIISLSLNTEVMLDEVVAKRYPYLCCFLEDIITVAKYYENRKKTLNVMDFDDLLLNCRMVLADFPEILKKYSERFFHVLVDEYQDTNAIQAKIVDLLASNYRNLTVVGDDSQSIYAFRGADFANIFHFPRKYRDCKIYKLETNYRSTPEIIHLANMSIVNNEKQFQKTLRAVRNTGIKPVLVPAGNVMQQANFVSQRILEVIREGVSLNEIAVLYRAHYHSMELQMEMTRRGIPFEIRSGIRFFEQAHIKDVTAYMRILANPYDEIAWKRVLGLYSKVGKITANKVWGFLSSYGNPLESTLRDDFVKCVAKSAAPGLAKCQKTMKNLITLMPHAIPSRIIEILLDDGYRVYLQEKYSDALSREDDLNQLSTFSTRYRSLENFLSELALMTNMTEESEAARDDTNGNRVILTTVHQAKGLEWSVVLIIWCSDGMFPLARALKEPGGEEEERRLFYVATTRAKDQLYLCYPLIDYSRGMGNSVLAPSRFISELSPSSRYTRACPYDQWIVDEEYRY